MSRVVNKLRCVYCGRGDGRIERTTFLDAPEGSVPVHACCLQPFFGWLDQQWPVLRLPGPNDPIAILPDHAA